MKKVKTLLTIDPGDKTGFAFWQKGKLIESGEFKANTSLPFQKQFKQMWVEFDNLVLHRTLELVLIEGVEVYGNSAKSIMCAKRGKHHPIPPLFKLAYLLGGYLNVCDNYDIPFEIPIFRDWGGNLSPEAVKAQIQYIIKKEFTSQHIYDAVGIGLNYWGKL